MVYQVNMDIRGISKLYSCLIRKEKYIVKQI